MKSWVPRVKNLSEQTETVQVFFNNCYSDYAQTNASTFIELLDEDL